MRCLLTGASGYVGQNILGILRQKGWEIDAVIFENELPATLHSFCRDVIPCDLRERNSVQKLVRERKPEIILHAAAMANTSRCEEDPEAAFLTNVNSTENLLFAAESYGDLKRFVFFSTDMVFDGAEPGRKRFSESSPVAPRSQYSRSKFQAECVVFGSTLPVSVLRLALVFGPGEGSFLGWMRKRFLAGEIVPLFFDEFRTPIFVHDIAEAVFEISANLSCNERLYHLGGPERISRVEFGRLVAEAFGYDPRLIEIRSRLESPGSFARPGDLSLDSSRLSDAIQRGFSSPREALEKIRQLQTESKKDEDS